MHIGRTKAFCLVASVALAASANLRAAPPDGGAPAAQTHWAFRPIHRPEPPRVRNPDWVDTPVDAFILASLERHGLEPAAPADKRTLIRRATYDLIGLPATPREVDEFLADDSPTAFARVVDRLLASPHYGERWGRHWLDVARYADTRGDTGGADPVSPFAFTYRDYVIRALNEDLPYDRFLIEQIAADQLERNGDAVLAALGFITVGRRFLNNAHDTIDDRIDVLTRGTMALTVSCARCHDHKYDPIPTQDYYSLYGVLANSREPDPLPVIGTPDPAALADYREKRKALEATRTELIQVQQAKLAEEHRKLTAEHILASRKPPEPEGAEKRPQFGFPDRALALRRVGAQRWRQALGKPDAGNDPVFAPWLAFAAIPDGEFAETARDLADRVANNALPHPVNPLVAKAFAGPPPETLAEVAQRYARLLEDIATAPTGASPAKPPSEGADADREALRRAFLGADGPGALPEEVLRQLLPPMVQMEIQRRSSELEQLDSRHAGAPVRAMALADNPQPAGVRVFIRGNPNNPGPEVPRQFLELLAGENRRPFTKGSGRLELAQAIADRANPLTARVIVNRVWLHHFGEGLVTTPDDFGVRSDPPSHPHLLDYLAAGFIDEGWSLKKLHRLLMLSRVYRQASDDGLRFAAIDPENRLLSKMNRRRLEFEALRDTLLFVSGSLDETVGGRSEELTTQTRTTPDGRFTGGQSGRPASVRRAIYGFVDRQNLPGVFRAFDFADPDTIVGRRFATTVPQQALFFLNSAFVMQQASRLVALEGFRALTSTEERVRYLYARLFQREPTRDELELARRFIAGEEAASAAPRDDRAPAAGGLAPLGPWEKFIHVLLMSDELMFVD